MLIQFSHPETAKIYAANIQKYRENQWKYIQMETKQMFPWKILSTYSVSLNNDLTGNKLLLAKGFDQNDKPIFVAYKTRLLGFPYWVSLGSSDIDAIKNMAWAITDDEKFFRKSVSSTEEYEDILSNR